MNPEPPDIHDDEVLDDDAILAALGTDADQIDDLLGKTNVFYASLPEGERRLFIKIQQAAEEPNAVFGDVSAQKVRDFLTRYGHENRLDGFFCHFHHRGSAASQDE